MSLPKSLIRIAAVGTEHASTGFTADRSDIDGLFDACQSGSVERRLLATVARIRLQQTVGWLPPTTTDDLETPCELDKPNLCSQEALKYLFYMLNGHFLLLLPDWLKLVAERGQVVPPEAVAPLMHAGQNNQLLKELIVPVLGQRARWLSEMATIWLPDLSGLDSKGREDYWLSETATNWLRSWIFLSDADYQRGYGPLAISMLDLRKKRKTDPAQARELIEMIWDQEEDGRRHQLITVFSVGLGQDDEAFLESALDDRSSGVRDKAIWLLSQLPASRFRQRMIDRARLCLEYDRSGAHPVVRLKLPQDFDPLIRRDGLNPDRVEDTVLSIIRSVDPQYWCDLWGITAEELFASLRRKDIAQKKVLFEAMTDAIIFTDSEGFGEFVSDYIQETRRTSFYFRTYMDVLPTASLDYCLAQFLAIDHDKAFYWLEKLHAVWSTELTRAVIAYLGRLNDRKVPHDEYGLGHLERYAVNVPPSMQDEFLAALAVEGDGQRERQLRELRDKIAPMLEFRRRMLATFESAL